MSNFRKNKVEMATDEPMEKTLSEIDQFLTQGWLVDNTKQNTDFPQYVIKEELDKENNILYFVLDNKTKPYNLDIKDGQEYTVVDIAHEFDNHPAYYLLKDVNNNVKVIYTYHFANKFEIGDKILYIVVK